MKRILHGTSWIFLVSGLNIVSYFLFLPAVWALYRLVDVFVGYQYLVFGSSHDLDIYLSVLGAAPPMTFLFCLLNTDNILVRKIRESGFQMAISTADRRLMSFFLVLIYAYSVTVFCLLYSWAALDDQKLQLRGLLVEGSGAIALEEITEIIEVSFSRPSRKTGELIQQKSYVFRNAGGLELPSTRSSLVKKSVISEEFVNYIRRLQPGTIVSKRSLEPNSTE